MHLRLPFSPLMLRHDLVNTVRDPLLLFISGLPIFLALLFRFLIPELTALLANELEFNLTPFYGLFVILLFSMTPMLFGWVTGFILLDNRDEHVLTAIAVTPLGREGYLWYRVSLTTLLSFLITPLITFLCGLVPLSLLPFLGISLLAGLSTPLFALLLAGLAGNKVEGMAIGKFLGLSFAAPAIAWFVDSPWQLLAGVFPSYWPARAFLAMQAGNWADYGISLLAGIILEILMLALLFRFYKKRS